MTFLAISVQLFDMAQEVKDAVLAQIKEPMDEFNKAFKEFVHSGQSTSATLERDVELLADIRKRFDSLSASVELEFEGTEVFSQEIKRTKELIEESVARVHESLSVSDCIAGDLDELSQAFDKIRAGGLQLEDTVKNINMVSDSIEVASRNAGITAFHAGTQGRGFEVIAREMTALVKNVQEPTHLIPETAHAIIKEAVELGHSLLRIDSIMYDLKDISKRFSEMTGELLSLMPTIEAGIKNISQSVEAQKVLHQMLLEENKKTSKWLSEIYDIARSSAILEISLEAVFRHINNIYGSLMTVKEPTSFQHLYRILMTVMGGMTDRQVLSVNGAVDRDIGRLEVLSSERSILQLVSETNGLFQTISSMDAEIQNWVKTNSQACDALAQGITLYRQIIDILSDLHKHLEVVGREADRIDRPLYDLTKITERSKVLGLYAGIESARGGQFASALGVVTGEIKDLSEKTTSFVAQLGDVANNMLRSISQLSECLIRSKSDVEQGIGSLQSAHAILDKNGEVLQNLSKLAQEMVASTESMTTHCNELSTKIRTLNEDYTTINTNRQEYAAASRSCSAIAGRLSTALQQQISKVIVSRPEYRKIVLRQSVEPIILDPANKTDARSHEVIEQVFAGLFTFDSSNHLVPGLARSFSVSPDGHEWDFVIRKNIRFHNGDKLTARHVADTVARVKQGPNANFIDYVNRVTTLDEYRIRFVLEYPYLPFLANLACGVCDITPSDFDDARPVGAGPYQFVRWRPQEEIVLDIFPDFYDGRAPVDQLIFKIIPDKQEACERFLHGEIDMMQVTADMIKRLESTKIVSGSILSTQYVGINVKIDTPFKHKEVRQAMNCVINKREFAEVVMDGQALPGYGVFPPGMPVYNKNLAGYTVNLDRAKDLMKKAGFGNGIDGTFLFDISEGDTAIRRAEYIQKCLSDIGIQLTLNPMPWRDFLEKGYRGQSILCMKSWVSDNGDPDNFLYPLFHSKSFGRTGNTSFYRNREVDTMIEQARIERNAKKRKELYRTIEKIIVDDAPWIFLSHGVDTYAVNNTVGGFKVDPFGIIRFRYLWSER